MVVLLRYRGLVPDPTTVQVRESLKCERWKFDNNPRGNPEFVGVLRDCWSGVAKVVVLQAVVLQAVVPGPVTSPHDSAGAGKPCRVTVS